MLRQLRPFSPFVNEGRYRGKTKTRLLFPFGINEKNGKMKFKLNVLQVFHKFEL